MANPDLPQEILVEIITRLPTKSIGRCRCLSKTWNTRLSTPEFINLHLSHKTPQEKLVILTRSQSLKVITSNYEVSAEIKLPTDWPIAYILCSCNGLVLLSCSDIQMQQLVVLNPITRQKVTLPYSSLGLLENNRPDTSVGFGYDHSCDDYKVVTLSRNKEMPSSAALINVYSVRKRDSKTVGFTPTQFGCPFPGNTIMPFVNDSVHWWFTNTESGVRIGAFDLVNETFTEVPFPKEIKPNYKSHLMVLGGCLCIVHWCKYGVTDVWMMKEYGLVDSWVRYGIKWNGRWISFRPVCFVGDDKLLSFTGEDSWVVCDLKDGSVKEVVGCEIFSADTYDWGSFVDTLVSPEQYPSF